jgi:hypothetical protein
MDSQAATSSEQFAAQLDPLLLPFVRAASEAEFEHQKAILFERYALPRIEEILRGKLRKAEAMDAVGAEEVRGEVQIKLLERLYALKADPPKYAISDFKDYVAGLTYKKLNDYFRRKYPQRHSLKAKLRYLMEKTKSGFAIWEIRRNEWLCGYEKWRVENKPLARQERYQQLLREPRSFPQAELAHQGAHRQPHPDLVAGILNWVDSPLELDDLVQIVAELIGVKDASPDSLTAPPLDGEGGNGKIIDPPAPGLNVEEEVVMKLKLQGLWREIKGLQRREHRAALLLNLKLNGECVIDLFYLKNIATISEIAGALQLSKEQLAELWHRLPLADLEIAELLGCARQDVINRRNSARRTLGRYLDLFW